MFRPIIRVLESDILAMELNHSGLEAANRNIRTHGEEARQLKGRLLNKSSLIQLAGVTDIYEGFGAIVNISQDYRQLPHDRVQLLFRETKKVAKMTQHLSALCDGGAACLTPTYHRVKESLKTVVGFMEFQF